MPVTSVVIMNCDYSRMKRLPLFNSLRALVAAKNIGKQFVRANPQYNCKQALLARSGCICTNSGYTFAVQTLQMEYTYPHVIENCLGEKLVIKGIEKGTDGDRLIVENYVLPGHGPVMHTHWQQDESLTVITGKLAYEIPGQPVRYAQPGETVLFERGVAHRFWNVGQEILHCKGYVFPANSFVFFLSSVFAAQNKTGSARPEKYDAAYLLSRYKSEYDLTDIPPFVKKVILPVTYFLGRLMGKYGHFKGAPVPLKPVR
jgi:quercetin dioxygenase-like cupin family protein